MYDDLPVTEGSITFDYDADVRSTLDLVIISDDPALLPLDFTDALQPYGQEVQVSMAAAASGKQAIEPTSIGWFRIQSAEQRERWRRKSDGTWRFGGFVYMLKAQDRMQILADARLLTPMQPLTTGTVFSEIERLNEDLVPVGDFSTALTDAAVSKSIVYEDDRLASMLALARSIGGDLTIDSNGQLVLRKPTQYGADPVWTFTCGDGGDVADYNIVTTRDGVINAVVARGEASTDHAAVQGVAFDNDPASPTRWGGPFGDVPLFYDSPLLLTATAAAAAATTRLNNYRRGREREFVVRVPPNFLLELDDPVQLELPNRTILGRIVKMQIPLRPTSMDVTVRALDSNVTVTEV